jgi:hypothetical protein
MQEKCINFHLYAYGIKEAKKKWAKKNTVAGRRRPATASGRKTNAVIHAISLT